MLGHHFSTGKLLLSLLARCPLNELLGTWWGPVLATITMLASRSTSSALRWRPLFMRSPSWAAPPARNVPPSRLMPWSIMVAPASWPGPLRWWSMLSRTIRVLMAIFVLLKCRPLITFYSRRVYRDRGRWGWVSSLLSLLFIFWRRRAEEVVEVFLLLDLMKHFRWHYKIIYECWL
jgi:hypothetical protein